MKKIIHIITGLGNGGAEMMLFKLLENTKNNKSKIEVISMMDEGIMGEKIEKLGIKVHTLNMNRGIPNLSGIKKAKKICENANIIQSWMYHADLFSFIVSLFVKPQKLIWGIRRSNLEKDKNKKSTLLIAKINSFLSNRVVNKIVSCSKIATEVHSDYGYCKEKIVTIPNGFSLEKYKYFKEAKEKIIDELKINKNNKILTLVGRWNILKDHNNCLEALKILKEKRDDFTMIFCGTGVDPTNKELVRMIKEKKLENNVIILGRRKDIPNIMSATDIYISSSSGEGFPNVVGEAMACECPCIVTDVGDSAYIVGDTGIVIPRQNSELLAKGIDKLLNLKEIERKELGKLARQRIMDNFEISKVVSLYEKLYI